MNKLLIGAVSLLMLAGCGAQSSNNNQPSKDKEGTLAKTTTCVNETTSGTFKTIIHTDGNEMTELEIINQMDFNETSMSREEAEKYHKEDQKQQPKGVELSLTFDDNIATYSTKVNVKEASNSVLKSFGLKESSKGKYSFRETIKGLTDTGYKCE